MVDDRTGRPEQVSAPAMRSIIKMIDMAIENGSLDPQDRDEVIRMFFSDPKLVLDNKAMGGMMNINDMITPVGYKEGTKDGTLVGDKEKLFGGKNRARVEKFVNEIIEGEGVTKDLGRGILSAVSIPGIAIKDLIEFLNPVKEAEGSEAFDELISKRQVLISRLNGERLFGGDENEIKSIMDQIKRIDEMMSMLRPKED